MTEENCTTELSETSPSVQAHLAILQSVIERMATNSTSSKSWCIMIVSAVLVIVADKSKPDFALIALLPTLLFLTLDAYYLAMEKGYRNSYNAFVKKVHDGTATPEDLYSIKPIGRNSTLRMEALTSFSVWGFYIVMVLLIGIIKWHIF